MVEKLNGNNSNEIECLRSKFISTFLDFTPQIIREWLGKFEISCLLFPNPAEIPGIRVFAIQKFFLQKSLISWGRSPFSVFKNHSFVQKRENEWFLKIQKWTSFSRNQWFLEEEVLKRKSQTLYSGEFNSHNSTEFNWITVFAI